MRVELLLEAAIVTVAGSQVPVEVTIRTLELAFQSRHDHVGVDVLEEQAPAGLQRPAAEELQVAVRD